MQLSRLIAVSALFSLMLLPAAAQGPGQAGVYVGPVPDAPQPQYSLPCYLSAGTSASFAKCPNMTTNSNGGLDIAAQDPWFSLGSPLYGARGMEYDTPVVTVSDLVGTTGSATVTSASNKFLRAVGGGVMTISLDTSIEPEMISSGTVSQGTCLTASPGCIQNKGTSNQAGIFAATISAQTGPIAGPTTAYFRLACTAATSVGTMTAANTGRWTREYIATTAVVSATQTLQTYSPVASTGTPTCPNGSTHYALALAIDAAQPATLPAAWYAAAASGTEWIQAVLPLGTDFTICASGCTEAAVVVSGTQPTNPVPATYTITTKNSNSSVALSANLTTTIAGAYAVYGYDDTTAISNWLAAAAVAGSGASDYCPPGSYLWNGTITWFQSGQNYMKVMGAGHASNPSGGITSAQAGSCEFVTIGTVAPLAIGVTAATGIGGLELNNLGWREGIPGVLGPTVSPITGTLISGGIFTDLAFTDYENTSGITISAGDTTHTSQYNDFTRLMCADIRSCLTFKQSDVDNRLFGGRFFGSRTGGGAGIDQQTNSGNFAGGNLWAFGFNCQATPLCYHQFDRAASNVRLKAENTNGIGTSNAPQIGSSGTGTFAVFDGTTTTNCKQNRFDDEQIGFFFLGLYNSSNCIGLQIGLPRFQSTTIQFNDNGNTPTFLPNTILVGPVAWSTATSIGGTQLCSTSICPAGIYDVSIFINVIVPCTTTGSYAPKVGWTDEGSTKAGQLFPLEANGALLASGTLVPTATSQYGSGSVRVRSNGGGQIQYATTAGACGTGGPATGNMYFTITRHSAN